MGIKKYKTITLISNVDDSILRVQLPGKRKFLKEPAAKIVDLICHATELPDHEVESIFDSCYCFDRKKEYVFTIESFFGINIKEKDRIEQALYDFEIIKKHNDKTDNFIKLLRLCRSGDITTIGHYTFIEEGSKWEWNTLLTSYKEPGETPFFLSDKQVKLANQLLVSINFPFKHAYINLAFENFNISYEVAELHLSFLSLMIALEVLFNISRNELRYRVSRNCSVLLSKNRQEFDSKFSEIKRLYDQRSRIVHTGDVSKLNMTDVLRCQNFVRESILKIIRLDMTKEELLKKLNFYGFRRDII
jgi:hypothetical protein